MIHLKIFTTAAALFIRYTYADSSLHLDRPWLEKARSTADRLQMYLQQLNSAQKLEMLQGYTTVSAIHHG